MFRLIHGFLIVFSLVINGGMNSFGQLNNLMFQLRSIEKKASILFEKKAYFEALELYEQIVSNKPTDSFAKLRLAECYHWMNKNRDAEKLYNDLLIKNEDLPLEVKLHYVEVLIKNGKRDSALKVINNLKISTKDSLVVSKKEALKHYDLFFQDSLACSIEKLYFNSTYSDISPIFFKEGVLFLSQRMKESPVEVKDSRTNSPFYNYYYSSFTNNSFGNPEEFTFFNNKYNACPLTFFDNYSKVIFCQNVLNKSNGNKILNLFISEFKENKRWTNPQPLPFNNSKYSLSHPFFCEMENSLYFVSDMPGGFGGTDLYKVQYNSGQWGKVINLGQIINTTSNEMFPFISQDSLLYFASDGHPGMGGLDIYTLNLSQEYEVINPGYPINSPFDDFGLVISPDGNSGLICSNRDDSGLNDDIYQVEFNSVRLEGLVVDRLKLNPIVNASVSISDDESGQVLRTTKTNSKGKYYYPIIPGRSYTITVLKDEYKTGKINVSSSSKERSTMAHRMILEKENKKFVNGKVLFDTIPLANSKVSYADLSSDSVETTQTDSLGSFQCEINTDTTNFFYVEKNDFKSIYVLKPIKKKRKGAGVSFVTIPVKAIVTKEIEIAYKDSSGRFLSHDTLVVKNDLSKEKQLIITNEKGLVKLNVWKMGKYSFYRREKSGDLILLQIVFPEEIKVLNISSEIVH